MEIPAKTPCATPGRVLWRVGGGVKTVEGPGVIKGCLATCSALITTACELWYLKYNWFISITRLNGHNPPCLELFSAYFFNKSLMWLSSTVGNIAEMLCTAWSVNAALSKVSTSEMSANTWLSRRTTDRWLIGEPPPPLNSSNCNLCTGNGEAVGWLVLPTPPVNHIYFIRC